MLKLLATKPDRAETKSFVFITTGHNNAEWVTKCLSSIHEQQYSRNKFKIVYVDDASTDESLNLVMDFKNTNPDINIMVTQNEQNRGPAYSRHVACELVEDHEICVFLDGDDWLIDANTLGYLSNIYNTKDVYATFGSFEGSGEKGKKEKWQYSKWKEYSRTEDVYFPHLRTCMGVLLKNIPERYLKYNDTEWLRFKTDVALFNCVVELCGGKYAFVKNKFMVYNRDNSINNPDTGFSCEHRTQEQIQTRENYGEYISNLPKLSPVV